MNTQFIRFIIVGLINTLFGYTVFALLLFLGLHYCLALAFATILGVLFNYKTNSKLVFSYEGNNRLFHYVFVYIVIYSINVTGVFILTSLGISAYLAVPILMLPITGMTYHLSNKLVFKR